MLACAHIPGGGYESGMGIAKVFKIGSRGQSAPLRDSRRVAAIQPTFQVGLLASPISLPELSPFRTSQSGPTPARLHPKAPAM